MPVSVSSSPTSISSHESLVETHPHQAVGQERLCPCAIALLLPIYGHPFRPVGSLCLSRIQPYRQRPLHRQRYSGPGKGCSAPSEEISTDSQWRHLGEKRSCGSPPSLVRGGVFIWMLGDIKVAGVIGLYLLINVLYSGKLKNIVLLDVFVIAVGFVLRVYAGAYAIHEPVSSFIFMTTLFLSLFLGFAKRKGELLRHGTASRTVLKKYGKEMLNAYLAVTMALTIMSYALWTMETNTKANLGTHRMVYSIVFVVFGMFWYVYILDKYNGSEDPTENLYKDKALLLTCCTFVGYVLLLFLNVA